MTKAEATSVAEIACQADGGYCINCAGDLIQKLQERFPEHKQVFAEVFDKHFGDY